MKKTTLISVLVCSLVSGSTNAGSVAGFGGATEYTQMINMAQLVSSYAKQAEQYVMQGLQYEAQLKNLMKNPLSAMDPEVANMISGIGRAMSAAESIGGTLSQIDSKFAATFNNSTAASFAKKFSNWNSASKGTLQAAMRAAGMHRDSFESNTAALRALFVESQKTDGNLAAVQTLAKINAKQVESTMALSDLIATQNIAQNTYLTAQTNKEQAVYDVQEKTMSITDRPFPAPRQKNPGNW